MIILETTNNSNITKHYNSDNHQYFAILHFRYYSTVTLHENAQSRKSGGSWFETCSGVWYPRRRPCGVALNTLVDSIHWLGKSQVCFLSCFVSQLYITLPIFKFVNITYLKLLNIQHHSLEPQNNS